MFFRSPKDLLNGSRKEVKQLNSEFEALRKKNADNSGVVRKSIQEKSNEFRANKKHRGKYFDIIRNK